MSTSPDGYQTLALAQSLVRVPSLTPDSGAGVTAVEALLRLLGFACTRLDFGDTANLYAELRQGDGPNLCFAGHTDVVPVGDAAGWSVSPFAAEIRNGCLYGRGVADMKGAIAAFIAATAAHLDARRVTGAGALPGAISFLITGDEEGPAVNGTVRVLDALRSQGVTMDACIVGEPTSELHVGDTIKNGRRGSLNLLIHAIGQQGHVAYPAKSRNALAGLLDFLQILREHPIDDGAEGFDPSHFEVTAVETGNPTHNVIPARASARANIRFNTRQTREGLIARIERAVQRFHEVSPVRLELTFSGSGEAFYSPPGRLSTILAQACTAETGRPARLSTSGGTSDARFIHAICPVAELGLRNETAHKVDEHVTLADLDTLTRIYVRAIGAFFA